MLKSSRLSRNIKIRLAAVQMLCGVGFISEYATVPALAADEPANIENDTAAPDYRRWSAMLFGGRMSSNNIGDVFNPAVSEFEDIYFAGGAVSRGLYRWMAFTIELEAGAGYQFADNPKNESGQVWGAAYLRYDGFPWNSFIRTSIAASTGLNYSFNKVQFEDQGGSGTAKLQHYFSPEITFAHPEHRDSEFVLRIHHRSAVFGLLGCSNCGSNVVTIGLRRRF